MTAPDWTTVAKRRMRELELRQDDLCAPLGVKTRGAVGHYLAGRRQPTPAQLLALAKKCRISVGELLTGEATSTHQPAKSADKQDKDFNPCAEVIDPLIIEDILSALAKRWPAAGEVQEDPRPLALTIAESYSDIYKANREYSRRRTEEILFRRLANDDKTSAGGERGPWDTPNGPKKS